MRMLHTTQDTHHNLRHMLSQHRKTCNDVNTFYYQLMQIMLKNAELLKHSKLDKNAPTCFGLHRNHLQGAKVSAWLNYTFG